MPNTLASKISSCAIVCGLAFLFESSLIAQTAPEISVPPEPKALVLALATGNGVPAEGARPWHMKISYTINNWDGSTDSQGVIEEFWLAPNRYKRIFATTTFNQVEYSGINGIRRTGSHSSLRDQRRYEHRGRTKRDLARPPGRRARRG